MIDLALIGLGNIGLAFALLVARLTGIRSVVLADHDVYSGNDVAGQLVSPRDAGRAKVELVAARMKEINPALHIETFQCRLEHMPRGRYKGRAMATCLDTRDGRAKAGDIAWAVQSPVWLDAGVRPDGALARVSVAFPAYPQSGCICCGWSDRDWSLIAREFSCMGVPAGAPSRSPAFLGAAAASMLAHLLGRYIEGALPPAAEVHTRTMSLDAHRCWTTIVRRNPACRCKHQSWNIEPLGETAEACTLGSLLTEGSLAIPGLPWVTKMRCSCGFERSALRLASRLPAALQRCDSCGGAMSYGALDLADEINVSAQEDLGPGVPALALAELGINNGDVIRLGDRLLEVGASARKF